MILPKYYCETCKQFKTKREVNKKGKSNYFGIAFRACGFRCKWCHEPVLTSKQALEEVMRDYYTWKEEKRRKYEIKLFTEHSM